MRTVAVKIRDHALQAMDLGASCPSCGRNYRAAGKSTRKTSRNEKNKIMGDRSPKSNQKKSSQKQAKASSASHSKAQAVAAKQAAGKKK
jgi:ssDNA-binding Zn-finger/Zn-ribbon topoisomerase 1